MSSAAFVWYGLLTTFASENAMFNLNEQPESYRQP